MHLLFDLGHAMLWLGIGKNIPVLSLSPLSCKMCVCVCVCTRADMGQWHTGQTPLSQLECQGAKLAQLP